MLDRLCFLVLFLFFISPITVAQQDGDAPPAAILEVDKLMQLGRDAMSSGKQDDALRTFNKVIKLNPDQGEAYYHLAILSFRRGNPGDGLKLIKRSVELIPEKPLPRLAYAKALDQMGKVDEAIEQYQTILAIVRSGSKHALKADADLSVLLLRRAVARKSREEISSLGAEFFARYENNTSVLRAVAAAYSKAGMIKDAVPVYARLVKLTPQNAASEYYYAQSLDFIKQFELAEQHYMLTIKKGGDQPIVKKAKIKLGLLRGALKAKKGDLELALQEYQSVLELDPKNLFSMRAIGLLSGAKKDFTLASKSYEDYLLLKPDDDTVRLNLGLAYLKSRRFFAAVRVLDYVLANEASDAKSKRGAEDLLGKLDKRLGGKVEQIRAINADVAKYEAIIADDPTDAEAYLGLAGVLIKKSKAKEAKEALLKAAELDASLSEPRKILGEMSADAGEYDEAIEYLNDALALTTDEEVAKNIEKKLLTVIAQNNLKKKNFDEAVEGFMLVLSRFDEADRGALWGLGVTYQQKGDMDASIEWFLKLLEEFPAHTSARLNLARLYERIEESDKAIQQYREVIQGEGQNKKAKSSAEQRIKAIRRQNNGLSYSAGFSVSVDDNLSSRRSVKVFEYRSDATISADYNYKIKKGLKFNLRVSPAYSVYHVGQYDYMRFSLAPTLKKSWLGVDWSVGLNRSTQSSVLRPERSSTTTEVLNLNASWKGGSGYMSFRGFGSQLNQFFGSRSITTGVSANSAGSHKMSISYGYALTVNENTHPIGSDYAYVSHALNGSVRRQVSGKLNASINGRLGLFLYSNPDLISGVLSRRNININIGGRLNYRLGGQTSLYAGYSYTIQYSSLPVGRVLSAVQAIEFRQSESLGGYNRSNMSFGVQTSF